MVAALHGSESVEVIVRIQLGVVPPRLTQRLSTMRSSQEQYVNLTNYGITKRTCLTCNFDARRDRK